MIVNCKTCGTQFKTFTHRLKIGRGKFCSKRCYVSSMIGAKQSEKTKRKRSVSLTGRKQSLQERLNKSIARKNHDWGVLKTPEKELIRKSIEVRLWREAVFARDSWTCQKCKNRGGNINSHHIENFSENPQLRTAIDNGVTLCQKCHIEFHKIFGKKTNKNDYITYKNMKRKGGCK